MKIFLAVLALVACSAGEEWTRKTVQQLIQIGSECLKENPLAPEQIDKLIEYAIPNGESFHKYQLCAAVKIGVFSHDHGFNSERMAKQFSNGLNEEDVKKISEDCVRQSQEPGKAADLFVFDHRICFLKSRNQKIQKDSEDPQVSKFLNLMYSQGSSIALAKKN